MPQRSDETLFMDGSDSAMASLVRRYEGPLFGFLRRWCGDPHLAEDLFQETFLKLFRSRHRFDPRRHFRPYLYKIAWNALRDARRLGRIRPVAGTLESVAECRPGPAAAADAHERQKRVRDAIATLPEAERIVVELRMYEGLTFREIAAATESKIPTAKSRMVYALRRLSPLLKAFVPEGAS